MTITEAIKKEFNYLSKGYEVYGIFLYGSQNYGLATQGSDIDTKAIIIPSFNDLALRQPVNKVMDFGCGKCEVKDIREMVKNYKKQNINFIETLFTIYYYINPKYEELHHELLQKRGYIARMDEKRALDCLNGMLEQAQKRMLHTTDTTKEDIEENGYHRKSLINVMKATTMIDKFTKKRMHSDILDCSSLKKYQNADITRNQAILTAEKYNNFAKIITEKYIEENNPVPDTETLKWLDFWTLRVLWQNMEAPSELNMLRWRP